MQLSKQSNQGFSLIEVLVSVFILSVGLLGLAGLQGFSLKQASNSYYRGQAIQLTYDMADRIRANAEYAKTGGVYVYETTSEPDNFGSACSSVASPCNPTEMAKKDIYEWWGEVSSSNSVLPKGIGEVSFVDPVFTIKVTWDDNRDGCTKRAGESDCGSNPIDPSFEIEFQL